MNSADIIHHLDDKFGTVIKVKNQSTIDPFVVVADSDWLVVAQYLRDDPRLHFDILNCITVVDYLETEPAKVAKAGFEPHLEVVYHLSSFTHRHRFVVKLLLPRWRGEASKQELPEVPSVCYIWPAANWHEREAYDLNGVLFTGHPNLVRILMADDWVGYPLRKDYEYPLEYQGIRCR